MGFKEYVVGDCKDLRREDSYNIIKKLYSVILMVGNEVMNNTIL